MTQICQIAADLLPIHKRFFFSDVCHPVNVCVRPDNSDMNIHMLIKATHKPPHPPTNTVHHPYSILLV